ALPDDGVAGVIALIDVLAGVRGVLPAERLPVVGDRHRVADGHLAGARGDELAALLADRGPRAGLVPAQGKGGDRHGGDPAGDQSVGLGSVEGHGRYLSFPLRGDIRARSGPALPGPARPKRASRL